MLKTAVLENNCLFMAYVKGHAFAWFYRTFRFDAKNILKKWPILKTLFEKNLNIYL